MNKIKLLYEVIKTMKAREVITGVLQAEVEKDKVSIFSIRNEFEKNLSTGQIKAKVTAAVDYAGAMDNHEQHTRDTMHWPPARSPHEILRKMHHCHAHGCEGLKRKLAKITFALTILDCLQIKEQEDKTIVVSLNANDLPEDMKHLIHERLSRTGAHHHHCHSFMKEFCHVEKPDLMVTLLINQKYEVGKIVITAAGAQTDDQAGTHDLTAKAELSFVN